MIPLLAVLCGFPVHTFLQKSGISWDDLFKNPYSPGHIVGVDEGKESLGKGEGVADECGQLPVRGLAGEDVEVLAQLQPPLLAQGHEILPTERRVAVLQ